MKRRDFLLAAGATAALPGSALAQQQPSGKMLRVGTANVQPHTAPNWVSFVRRMAEIGYVEGKNFIFDHVQVPDANAYEALYREVVARKPDIILAGGPERSLTAAKAAAGALPIVMLAVDYDPIARGHVESLARPGGTVTGINFQNAELAAKHLSLIKEMSPRITEATVIWDKLSADYWAALQRAAPQSGLRLTGVEMGAPPYDYERVIAAAPSADIRHLIAIASPFFYLDRVRLAEVAIKYRFGLMTQTRESAVAGALMCYGANIADMWALAATYVDRIAKGAKPADLAVQQPVKFEMVLNMKTAKVLGLEVPTLLLARADEVIE